MPYFEEGGRFFTPLRLEPLNLDLASLRGGGFCPAQFWGETHDGRDIFGHFRGGWLSITVADAPGADAWGGLSLLKSRLGPPLYGTLSLGQLCHYAGITINGVCPPLPSPREMYPDSFDDFSGATTFYNVRLDSTAITARSLVDRLMADFPDFTVVQFVFDTEYRTCSVQYCTSSRDIRSLRLCFIMGDPPPAGSLAGVKDGLDLKELVPNQTIFWLTYCGFDTPTKIGRYGLSDDQATTLGKRVQVAGVNNECQYEDLHLETSFPKGDVMTYLRVMEFNDTVDACFPQRDLLCFDLQSGQRRPDFDETGPVDPAIADWVAGGDDRWLRVRANPRQEPSDWVGYRPAQDT